MISLYSDIYTTGVSVSGKKSPPSSSAFANLLMAVEFGHSFEEFLELDPPPSLHQLYGALYNIDMSTLVSFIVQLLKAALYDPGRPLVV